ncbi:MAG: hypothetical protein R6X25_07885 [Candidatus Krumholzibacteriia bacterium]
MHVFRSFPDLHPGDRGARSGSTLWPSFADIMTVILMVFMLTMVAVIIKNASLLESVRLSHARQTEAEAALQVQLGRLADLTAANVDLEEQLRDRETQIIVLTDEQTRLQDLLDARMLVIERLEEERADLQESVRVIRMRVAEQEEELAAAQGRITEVTAAAEARRDELRRELEALLRQLNEKDAFLITLQDEKSDLQSQLDQQRQDFASMEDEYLRLLRPARSPHGKQVATVQYYRLGPDYHILFKDVGATEAEEVSRDELHRRLGALKERLGDDLYVKIVIPDASGLSFNEAWRFTDDILSRYDYYHAESPPEQARGR